MPPMKGNGIKNPNSARLGIVCITFAIPKSGPRRRFRRVIKIPSGKAIAMAIAVEIKTSHTCCATCATMSDQLDRKNSFIELSADYADFTDLENAAQNFIREETQRRNFTQFLLCVLCFFVANSLLRNLR